ncbi:hypothetical protein pdam_00002379 [Pocillopora damicornis]|uniref:Uncharacterized protein n=1 Tax=Pocillopora damicornis TaxID=46731 RepID=A0A3M6USU6_POCDA|nr:hypothetical protein pdam_00002379 [Pocillopora damicornis]
MVTLHLLLKELCVSGWLEGIPFKNSREAVAKQKFLCGFALMVISEKSGSSVEDWGTYYVIM